MLARRRYFQQKDVQELVVDAKGDGTCRGRGPVRRVNVTEGLKLGAGFVSRAEQQRLVKWILQ